MPPDSQKPHPSAPAESTEQSQERAGRAPDPKDADRAKPAKADELLKDPNTDGSRRG